MGVADNAERKKKPPTTPPRPPARTGGASPTPPPRPTTNPYNTSNGVQAVNNWLYAPANKPYTQEAADLGLGSQATYNWVGTRSSGATPQTMPTMQMPTAPTSSGGGGGGGGGSSAAAAQRAAAIAAIQTLFQQYGKPADNTLNDQLATLTGQAQTQGNQAMANLNAMLGTYTNPYGGAPAGGGQGAPQNAQSQIGDLFAQIMGQAATDPQGAQARASGLPPDVQQQLAAMQAAMQGTGQTVIPEGGLPAGGAMAAAGGGQPQQGQQSLVPGVPADYAQAAAGQWNDMLRQSFEAQMMGRRQDAAMSQTSFQQALANNQAAYGYQNSAQEKKRKDDMMASILQMAIQNGINLADIGVSF